MPTYLRENGTPTTAEDPQREVWYGFCTYWTDDWSLLSLVGPGVPVCPCCKRPGFQIPYSAWEASIARFAEANPLYLQFVQTHKQTCEGTKAPIAVYKDWLASQN